MIVDDSIVRGNTSKEIVKMVRDFGAKEIYFVSACPPITHPCFYGVDIPTRAELIASNESVEEIRKHIDADILLYQELDALIEAVTRRGEHDIYRPCAACLDGNYVTGGVDEQKMIQLEEQRNSERAIK
jgi:amidophosphoribosyltransferase